MHFCEEDLVFFPGRGYNVHFWEEDIVYWFKLSRSALILECLLFGLKNRGLLILLLPDVSPASVAGTF